MIELKRVCSISLYDSFAPRDNSYSALHENVASVKRYVLQRYYQGFLNYRPRKFCTEVVRF